MNPEQSPRLTSRWWWPAIALVFVLAVVTRVAFLLEVRHDPVYVVPGHDEGVNDQVARAILAGRMPNSPFYKAPLYMYSLAGVYAVLGESPDRARWLQAVVFSAIPVLLAAIGRRLFGWLPGLIAGLIGAFYWGFVFYSIELVDTSLAALLYLVLGYLLIALPEGRRFTWLICGVALGLGAITRPNITASVPLLILAIFFEAVRRQPPADTVAGSLRQRIIRPLIHAMIFLVGIAVPIAPVTLHNRIIGGEWVPIATYGGLNAWSANSPWSNGKDGSVLVGEKVPDAGGGDPNDLWVRLDLNLDIAITFAQQQLGRPLKVGEADRFFYRRTTQYIRENPRKFLTDTFKRCCWFFNAHEYCNLKDMYRVCGVSKVLAILSYGHWGVLCPLAVLGVLSVFGVLGSKPRAPGMVYYLVMWLALFLGGVFFVIHSRFRLPPIYVLVPFVAYGLVTFIGLWSRRTHWTRRLIGCGVLAGVGVFSNLDLFGYSVSGHTELQLTYAEACLRTGRMDLLPEATRSFEQAYWAEVANGGRPWVLALHHAKPLTWLFACYHRLGNTEKALQYGNLMVRTEPMSPPTLAFFRMLLENGRQEEAREVLNTLEATQMRAFPATVIELHLEYWNRFHEKAILVHTEQLLAEWVRKNPGNASLAGGLQSVRMLLGEAGLSPQPNSNPSTHATHPVDPKAEQ